MRRALVATVILACACPSLGRAEPLVAGHSARLLTTGEASFAAKTASIEGADVVMLKTYEFVDDDTGRAMVTTLASAARAGKKVFVEFDVKGTDHTFGKLVGLALGFGSSIPPHLQPLVDAGVTLIPTNRPRLGSVLFGRDHDKLLVTWKSGEPARVIMGGMNVGNPYAASGNWDAARRAELKVGYRDTDVEFSGPEAARVIARFIEAAGRAKPGAAVMAQLTSTARIVAESPRAFEKVGHSEASVEFVSNDPKYGKNPRAIERLHARLIDETPAGETITMANGYTDFTKRIEARLVNAMRHGVKVQLFVNTVHAPEGEASVAAAFHDQLRGLYKKIPPGALEVTEFSGDARRNEGSMHQKIAKFGASGPVLIGSHNQDSVSANYNSEAATVVQNHRVGQQFDGLVNRMHREGKTRSLDQATLRRESPLLKLKGFLLNRVVGRLL